MDFHVNLFYMVKPNKVIPTSLLVSLTQNIDYNRLGSKFMIIDDVYYFYSVRNEYFPNCNEELGIQLRNSFDSLDFSFIKGDKDNSSKFMKIIINLIKNDIENDDISNITFDFFNFESESIVEDKVIIKLNSI
jgi:hypothetical protein